MSMRMALILAAMMIAFVAFAAHSVISGETNGFSIIPEINAGSRGVIVSAPDSLTELGVRRNDGRRWTGCGYEISWGDGSVTPQAWMGNDCTKGIRHSYNAPGVYRVRAKVDVPREADGGERHWSGEMEVVVR